VYPSRSYKITKWISFHRQKGQFFLNFCRRKGVELDNSGNSMHNARMSHAQNTVGHLSERGNAYFIRSYAKINLTLDVLGKRTDGYHELATIMQTVDLYDTLCLTATADDQVRVICSRPELNTDENLAARAARAVRRHCSITQGLVIELDKRIPVAAGLGGGSSNAAAVLIALQQWWQLQISPADMLAIAASLGSDVPFFLTGGLALCEGRGEYVTPLVGHWPMAMRWLLLLKPSIGVSTAAVFRSLPASDYTDGAHSRAVRTALETKSQLEPTSLHNSLERGVLERYLEVAQAREHMLRAGATCVRLSGSGPTLFAPFSQLDHAAQVSQQLHAQGYEVALTRAIHPNGVDVRFF
jgi:4-diphosphocytidyl-2-C-methyl-D-erythritol kinase